MDGEPLQYGRIYVAPSDRHLLLLDGRLRLSRGPSENGHRPAIDPLFRSAARAFGPRAIGVILSGSGDDGADGLATVVKAGGLAVVQDPGDALHPWMPLTVRDRLTPDHLAPVAKISDLLSELVRTVVDDHESFLTGQDGHVDAVTSGPDLLGGNEPTAGPAVYGCPQCGGALYETRGAQVPRYRCRVGHAWSPDSLLQEQAVVTEGALWMALRALADKSSLSYRMAVRHAPVP